jgi:UDP-N-acetylglucosamine 1-carboxyvinyltransferase
MTFLNVYRKVGGQFTVDDHGIRFSHPGDSIRPVVIETDVHPGFMTDWQQPMIVALTQAEGRSIVHETVYENRFGFTDALRQMGANIEVYKEGIASITRRVPRRPLEQAAVITGPTPLRGACSTSLLVLAQASSSRVSPGDSCSLEVTTRLARC